MQFYNRKIVYQERKNTRITVKLIAFRLYPQKLRLKIITIRGRESIDGKYTRIFIIRLVYTEHEQFPRVKYQTILEHVVNYTVKLPRISRKVNFKRCLCFFYISEKS